MIKEVSHFYKKFHLQEESLPQKTKLKVFLFYFLCHRLLFAFAITTFYYHPRITLEILAPLQTVSIIFVSHTRLLKTKVENTLLSVEAIVLLIMILILVVLENFSVLLSSQVVEIIGLAFIGIGLLQLTVSILIALSTCLRELRRKCKNRRKNKPPQIFTE